MSGGFEPKESKAASDKVASAAALDSGDARAAFEHPEADSGRPYNMRASESAGVPEDPIAADDRTYAERAAQSRRGEVADTAVPLADATHRSDSPLVASDSDLTYQQRSAARTTDLGAAPPPRAAEVGAAGPPFATRPPTYEVRPQSTDSGEKVVESRERQESRVQEMSDAIRSRDKERLVTFDKEGQATAFRDGEESSVSLTGIEGDVSRADVVLHNHPGGTSFSDADVEVAAYYDVPSMRVAGSNGYDYKIGPPEGKSWTDVSDGTQDPEERARLWEGRIADVESEVEPQLAADYAAGRMTYEEANADYWHRVWTRAGERYGIEYSRS